MFDKKNIANREKVANHYITQLYKQDRHFIPGIFWEAALKKINENYINFGTKNFRNDEINLQFFVPTFGPPGNGLTEECIKSLLNPNIQKYDKKQKGFMSKSLRGHFHAEADYRTLMASMAGKKLSYFSEFSESKYGSPIEQFRFEGRDFSRSSLNYLLGLAFLKSVDPLFIPRTTLEIGGGFGTLGEILGKSDIENVKYIDLDLPPMFLIAEDYIKKSFKSDVNIFDHLTNQFSEVIIRDLPMFSFLPNWKIRDFRGKIDLFVNFISFQEMEPKIVKKYLTEVMRLKPKYILLRNLREGKQVSKNGSLGVRAPVKTSNYLSYLPSYKLVKSNVLPFGYITSDNFHSELLVFKRK